MRTAEIFTVWYVNSNFSVTAAALFLSNTIFCSIFLSMSLLEHSLLYFDIFEGKLFNQINKAITEEFFIVYFILTAKLFSL